MARTVRDQLTDYAAAAVAATTAASADWRARFEDLSEKALEELVERIEHAEAAAASFEQQARALRPFVETVAHDARHLPVSVRDAYRRAATEALAKADGDPFP